MEELKCCALCHYCFRTSNAGDLVCSKSVSGCYPCSQKEIEEGCSDFAEKGAGMGAEILSAKEFMMDKVRADAVRNLMFSGIIPGNFGYIVGSKFNSTAVGFANGTHGGVPVLTMDDNPRHPDYWNLAVPVQKFFKY
jgi:hypothetical protein